MTVPVLESTLGLELGAMARVYLEIAACLRSEPALAGAIETWAVHGQPGWAGGQAALDALSDPAGIPSAAQCPCVVLLMSPSNGQAQDNISQQATLGVEARVWVAQGDDLTLAALWHHIQLGVYPDRQAESDSVRYRLQQAGASSGEVLIGQPIFTGTRKGGDWPAGVRGAIGQISVRYEIQGA